MSESAQGVQCPACGKWYRWTAQLAGQKLRCTCGLRDWAPKAPTTVAVKAKAAHVPAPAADADELLPSSAPAPASRAALARAATAPLAASPTDEEEETPASSLSWVSLIVPIIMAGSGIFLTLGGWITVLSSTAAMGALAGGLILVIQIIVFVPLAIVAAFTTARWFDLGFGALVPAVIKLVAVALGPGAVADLMVFYLCQFEFDSWYVIMAFFFYSILCGIPLMIIFRTDMMETAVLVLLQAAPRIGCVFGCAMLFPSVFASMQG